MTAKLLLVLGLSGVLVALAEGKRFPPPPPSESIPVLNGNFVQHRQKFANVTAISKSDGKFEKGSQIRKMDTNSKSDRKIFKI